MCLTIELIPSKKAPFVVKCYKRLKRLVRKKDDKKEVVFVTPYMKTVVPKNGCQIPAHKIKYTEYAYGRKTVCKKKGARVEGGAIHAYVNNRDVSFGRRRYVSYAFNVYAYGTYDDLVCKMLYTPVCDQSKYKEKRVDLCEQLVKSGKRITWDEVYKNFQ